MVNGSFALGEEPFFLLEHRPPPQKMSDDLAERLRRYLDADGYEPQDARSMARALGLSSSAEQKQLRALLQAACVRGDLLRLAKGLYARRRPRGGSLTGRVRRLAGG